MDSVIAEVWNEYFPVEVGSDATGRGEWVVFSALPSELVEVLSFACENLKQVSYISAVK
jgi:hypothetical protein